MDEKVLVTGASGQLGALVVEALLARLPAAQVVALVRREEAAEALRARGVEVRLASYDDRDALEAAFAGIGRLLLISGTDFDRRVAQHANVIEAARAAGVGFVAYTSVLRAETSRLMVAEDHRQTEAALVASGLRYALLRNGWYTENYTASAPMAVAHGALIGAAGSARIASAARADYAEAAAVVLSAQQPESGRVHELAGSESFGLVGLAAVISAVSGKEVPYVDMSEAAYKAALVEAGLPDPIADLLASSDAAARDHGDLEGSGAELEALIGRVSTPLRASVEAALA
ncbi:NAD-dependent epimerase/dehydratase family protein [Pseudooceanicola sediminis]|uniref:NAD-dependent epimerase/dehydratase family protein n=1 Tax=Pseudooceanicola sediminis TaxID=2211117 RepID=A0A399J2P0_9RHOB|nr:NmrA family NAD(P)-binding protein [Pseudooceanicola sediminis]KAA2317324.1 NAD(P)H-binding protein [Puniceibacterium sp. HSS470]RII39678.1 NAD-dependent epimerase/dehydratase family protein [Pseudooceanicola sediminis]|tara:strand:- start:14 stop:880 length:867 start_codon:yes stop_codon:yes gene_type:complete